MPLSQGLAGGQKIFLDLDLAKNEQLTSTDIMIVKATHFYNSV